MILWGVLLGALGLAALRLARAALLGPRFAATRAARRGGMLRAGGALLLAAGLALCLWGSGSATGLVWWCGGLIPAALLLVFLLPTRRTRG